MPMRIVVSAHHEVTFDVGCELQIRRPDAIHADHTERLVVIRRAEADRCGNTDEQHDRQDPRG
ncbi:MAG TPA: hypothetical protein VI056_07075 [Candidatus Limnocylindria bacterium]